MVNNDADQSQTRSTCAKESVQNTAVERGEKKKAKNRRIPGASTTRACTNRKFSARSLSSTPVTVSSFCLTTCQCRRDFRKICPLLPMNPFIQGPTRAGNLLYSTYRLLRATTRTSSVGLMMPVPGRIPGTFHSPPDAGSKSHSDTMLATTAKMCFSAKTRPLQMP